jgi:cytochrome c oxidase cbb3-type subunit I/II
MERFAYDDGVTRGFLLFTVLWGIVGMLVGLIVALQLVFPQVPTASGAWNWPEFLTFGRLRPLHTNAVIFAFAGNAFFAGAYYSTQRLLKARMFSDLLSRIHLWGWQLIIVAAALTLPLGKTQGKEYAELEWPIDVAITLVWVVFAVNFVGTLLRRRERHMYVAIWFYLASIITVALLHVFNNHLAVPAGPLKSFQWYAGVQDAFMQWWYGHNAVAFFLTTPFLGLMYYFVPKAAGRPVYSYRLSILHFWSLVFLYIWAGPHHLQYTALPAWAGTLGMVFSVMLWMPSWGGMINGLLTLRGAWHEVARDPILKFFVVAVTFYGMSTFEGPMLSVRSVNALAHYTDWIIAHVHSGGLGWNGFLAFGMAYWLLPRLWKTELFSRRLAEIHFWIATIGILLYIVAMYSAGVTQGLMWRAFTESGRLAYPDFVETVVAIRPMYWVRALGGALYVAGAVLAGFNVVMTVRRAPKDLADEEHEAPALVAGGAHDDEELREPLPADAGAGRRLWAWLHDAPFHRRWEALPITFTVLVTVAVLVGSVLEAVPLFLVKSNVPTISSVHPYTPLEVAGRDIYVREGCYTCHSQMVRPLRAEIERYGEYSKPGEFVHDHPFQWGSRRIGPDLHRVGGKYPHLWHVRHMEDPQSMAAQSVMPAYPWLLTRAIDFDALESSVRALDAVGVPYERTVDQAAELARLQAAEIATEVETQGGGAGLADKEITALIAYLQRLGTDIHRLGPEDGGQPPPYLAAAPTTPARAGK